MLHPSTTLQSTRRASKLSREKRPKSDFPPWVYRCGEHISRGKKKAPIIYAEIRTHPKTHMWTMDCIATVWSMWASQFDVVCAGWPPSARMQDSDEKGSAAGSLSGLGGERDGRFALFWLLLLLIWDPLIYAWSSPSLSVSATSIHEHICFMGKLSTRLSGLSWKELSNICSESATTASRLFSKLSRYSVGWCCLSPNGTWMAMSPWRCKVPFHVRYLVVWYEAPVAWGIEENNSTNWTAGQN